MKDKKITEREMELIKKLVFAFADMELEFIKKYEEDNRDSREASELIFHALVNIVGNFIQHNATDSKARIYNYKRFLHMFSEWGILFEEKEENNKKKN